MEGLVLLGGLDFCYEFYVRVWFCLEEVRVGLDYQIKSSFEILLKVVYNCLPG